MTSPTTAWALLLPPGWSRIKLDHDRPQQVAALVERSFAGVSRDQAGDLRRMLRSDLENRAEKAAASGGREFYLLSEVRRGLPVAATCLVSVVPEPLPADVPAEIFAQTLATGTSQATVLDVAGEPVPAVRRTQSKTFDAAVPGVEATRLTFTGLDVYVPFPDRTQILLLSFRTPVEPIAASMMVLFEAIAGSLRWREA